MREGGRSIGPLGRVDFGVAQNRSLSFWGACAQAFEG
jgi:hypothetical protein